MRTYRPIFILLAAILGYAAFTTFSGCAQIGMPTGGLRDSLPPVLLKSSPPNNTIHFSGKNITFTFDEYVHLQDIQKYLLISPIPKTVPNINAKLKTVSIRIRDTLQPNTTYSFQLGDAIQDINENNPLHNFTYIFSTGSYIDSLTLSGKVILAETGKADSTLLVFLYNNLEDSAVYKEKPRYVARLDSSGRYTFKNLASGIYHLFALKDESGLRMYNNKTQLFAFADSSVHIAETNEPVTLYAYREEREEKRPSSPPSASSGKKNEEKVLNFTTSLAQGQQDLLSPLTLSFAVPLKNFDSTKIILTDTLFQTTFPAAVSIDTTFKQVTISAAWTDNTPYRLLIDKDFAADTLGSELPHTDTLKFDSKKESDYGSIKITFTNLQKIKNPVLQFVQNNEVSFSAPLAGALFSRKLFKPGEYEIRLLDDENHNGVWDPGNYDLRKQPELVTPVPKKIAIRANWDNETDIAL